MVEWASEDAFATIVATDLGIINENQKVLNSMHNACIICYNRWYLRVNEMERNLLFEGLETEDGDTSDQHEDDANPTHVNSSSFFTMARNDDKAEPSGMGVIDLTSGCDGEV